MKEIFFNREISWVEFNYRVLEEALDKTNPLLERLKFLAIFSNNLDEFVMVRISGLISQVSSNYKQKGPSGKNPEEILEIIIERLGHLVEIQYNCLRDEVLKGLEKEGFKFYTSVNLPTKYITPLKELFLKKFFMILTPMAIDKSRPFPFLTGKSINILVHLKDLSRENDLFAVIPVPQSERFIPIPGDTTGTIFIYIEEFIKLYVNELFKGYSIINTCAFRITRDAELSIDEEEVVDLLSAIEDQLKVRERGNAIRLEVEASASEELVRYLSDKIKFYRGCYFPIDGPLDLSSFFLILGIKGYDHIKNEDLHPIMPIEFSDPKQSMFDIISKKDRIIHLPFESFDPVLRLIKEASEDEKVLAIKLTLYRSTKKSPLIKALKKAAENGKQVTVLVELKARFDEARNIDKAKELEKVGCHVIYGLMGLKIHGKVLLIVRDEKDGIKRYIHLSTGNYNENTAKLYTDIGFFTAKNTFGRDVSSVFNLLTGFSEPPRWKQLVTAPLDLRNFFLEKINIEIENIQKGGKGLIIAKMNSLIDISIIQKLYKASQSGVEIKLIVRGMCRLVPGVQGLSENITVISIVDRFLEHSRIYYFYNSGEENIYLSSADWMERNLDRRVEILFPLLDVDLKKELLECLKIGLRDNIKKRILNSDGMYEKYQKSRVENPHHSQIETYKYYQEQNSPSTGKKPTLFIPKMNPEEEKKL